MQFFRRLTISTLVAVYVLILVGGIVRSTGSGMGCPDWPKCFGTWVPPTSVSELPQNYKEVYSDYREKKNQRFAKYLSTFGFKKTAEMILNNQSILVETDFNVTKTWTEYVNRLVGVIIGLLIFAVALFSLRFWRTERKLTILAVLTFFLVGFQGWIGSFVVSTNLTAWTVTVHMFLALLIAVLLIYLIDQSSEESISIESPNTLGWVIACMAVLLIQILFGTRVREAIDQIASQVGRDGWIANIQTEFILHRSFSWVVLLFHAGLILKLRKSRGSKVFPLTLILLILGAILTGIGMAYFGVPPYLQPVHLLLATVSFGMQFLLALRLNRRTKAVLIN